ncbi:MAG: stage II sporulation protein M [Planctomycetaceae bacterium]|nr:stage II sporulation protein M [Planctomycetaceae bacterium]
MNKKTFMKTRQPAWEEFSELLAKRQKAKRYYLSGAEVQQFSTLYRELCNDLSMVRSRKLGEDLEAYLNALVSRGHNLFYQSPPVNVGQFWHFVFVDYPRTFRANWKYFLLASLLFFGPFLCSWVAVQIEPELAERILSSEQLEDMSTMYSEESVEERRDVSVVQFGEERSGMFGFYIFNNVGIALRTFAGGILFGVVTVYTLISNGLVLGTVSGFLLSEGHGDRFLSFIISHGSFELTAIAIAGGAGLILGHSMIHPGQQTRFQALKTRGVDALKIALGAAVMLVVAAFLEAFWSPADIPNFFKYTMGSTLWLVVALYLMFSGRK